MHQHENPWAGCDPVRKERGPGPRQRGRGGPWGGPWGGPPPWLGELFGQQWQGGRSGPWAAHAHRGGGSRRPRVRRGDVRTAILAVLGEAGEPTNGYQVIQQISERSNGHWKPSPGSVYPTIAQLEDEGLVEDAPAGRKALQLTDAGQRWLAEHDEEVAALWEPFTEQPEDEPDDLRQVIGQAVAAIVQIASTGTPDQRERAVRILADTRRRLYGVLADGSEEPDDEDVDGLGDEEE